MSNTDLIIEERSRDIGDFLVGRLIPFRKKRMVGPFIFIDHMGPTTIKPGTYLDIDQHPHIGLSTLTYLFEGEVRHQDSIGSDQHIKPGSVNWMTAGKGVVHTERTPTELRHGQQFTMHGYQIWVALPIEKEDMDPEFHHLAATELPTWKEGSANFKLIAGKGFGKESPLPVHSDLFMIEIETEDTFDLHVKGQLSGEIGFCIVEGSINACDQKVEKGNMLVSKTDNECGLQIAAKSRVLLFGGEPFPEERHIFWNFVSSSKEKIEAAKESWRNKSFPQVPNDETYIPLP
ncbi:pirin family protein [Ekhidna sp. MALMAid0563]|uniref:pirin family protein n=1 Tax=Ekhidna sp. MALMAid0563 TaxID=3143937 RepID=UPI0032DF636C